MKVVVGARCLNGEGFVERFLKGYSFADRIIIADGGSTDRSKELFEKDDRVKVVNFEKIISRDGYSFNPENEHTNFLLDTIYELNPDWIILDDLDDVPNQFLRETAKDMLNAFLGKVHQINAFRLYMWNNDKFFPEVNNDFDQRYTSLWAWNPANVDIRAKEDLEFLSFVGLSENRHDLFPPNCLLHKSWNSETIDEKMMLYNLIGIPMRHPFEVYGTPTELPEWAHE